MVWFPLAWEWDGAALTLLAAGSGGGSSGGGSGGAVAAWGGVRAVGLALCKTKGVEGMYQITIGLLRI